MASQPSPLSSSVSAYRTAASPSAAVTLSGGAGGIRLADLVGKLNASPASVPPEPSSNALVFSPKTGVAAAPAPAPAPAEERKLRASPATTKAATISTAVPPNNTINNNSNTKSNNGSSGGSSVNNNNNNSGSGGGGNAAAMAVPRSGTSKDNNSSAKPKVVFTIPREIANGEFVIRRGEALPFFRRLMKMRLSEELNKAVARE
ncbi:putative 5-3 exonuclease XRNA [Trypanosoma grayi]|uniref:putative 5-3 exonuclease XRNA n=1 Tax=Trypanosoma grayi TaxID=71804 RepID=UPI0004F4504E|nr:putative 5-3 exonuclease XRNA [Trypanosoma grayi]KEG06150.1 putative 5-3 exonuclease XRNA [Trypanosoma grayi]